ncbi:hypothetical protein CC79DRAFT_1366004 [Sarocladium strictum]
MAEPPSTGGNGGGQDGPSQHTSPPTAGNTRFIFKDTHDYTAAMLQILSEINQHQHLLATGTAEEKLQAFKAINSLILNAASFVEVEPWMVDKGAEAFLCFDKELTQADAVQLASELQVAKPGTMEIRPEIILRLHEVIRSQEGMSQDPKVKQTLRVFLDIILNKAQTQSIPDDTDEAVTAVKGLLLSVSTTAYEQLSRKKPAYRAEMTPSATGIPAELYTGFAQMAAEVAYLQAQKELLDSQLQGGLDPAKLATLSEIRSKAAKCTNATELRALSELVGKFS